MTGRTTRKRLKDLEEQLSQRGEALFLFPEDDGTYSSLPSNEGKVYTEADFVELLTHYKRLVIWDLPRPGRLNCTGTIQVGTLKK